MKRIVKGPPPAELLAWSAGNRATPNFNYGALPGAVLAAVKRALLAEQGWLCCYTGHGLEEDTSHVEHFKPRNQCLPGEDVAYNNLHAAYPRDGGDAALSDAESGYGAPFKAGWFDAALISPLSERCEARFRFALDGQVHPANDADQGAHLTIERLGLNRPALRSRRQSAIAALLGDAVGVPPLTAPALRRLGVELDRRDGRGRFRPFCFALRQATATFLEKVERNARQRAFARRGQPSS